MKKNLSVYCLLLLSCCFIYAHAQDVKQTIVEELNTPKSGQGKMRVLQDAAVESLISSSLSEGAIGSTSDALSKVTVYRILVFSDNKQQESKAEAERKQKLVKEQFPDLDVNIQFNPPPFWRVYAGSFLTREEADEMLKEMRAKFTSFGKEMYVIQTTEKWSRYQ